ncbi:MAG TPA: DNA repair protein RadA [Bacteroidales bacterium]|nr:DNA repair protein RadA [Bacteroidales bacterium]HPB88958.1 DNA repair protein RadA [Bacteroidales bacterium]HPH52883.1 DNA repair protein RadA [Bacteroidales bacterium]HPY21807.1 DNA repair protein RadA [Bacteroidales bacterium]HQA93293.1 DNA repair protein RadA [Bacteroidales bacterium]
MAKRKSAWFCSSCGNESPKWMGRCPACGEWNSMVEEPKSSAGTGGGASGRNRNLIQTQDARPQLLTGITFDEEQRFSIGNTELDRILGGGMVQGSMILIGGEPGIGKSTLSLQIPLHASGLKTLYVSGEESAVQIKLRAQRLQGDDSQCYVLGETLLENILVQAKEVKPSLLIIDSIQTIYSENIESSAGSVSQVRECASVLLRYAKESNVPVILIGHITKDGSIAGPKILEHIVDVVLLFEGDTKGAYRILRSIKNRFGSTDELAVFEMTGNGLREVSNPSEIFMPMHKDDLSGVAVSAMMDGTRPFLIEIQSLVSTATYGTPQRSTTGFDVRRLNMLLAVLEKRAGFRLAAKDVFLNIAGGLRVSDPACDLAIAAAILSSNFDLHISPKICFAAEVGLSGEIRPVSQVERRIAEAEKLGFEQIFISSYNKESSFAKRPEGGITVTPISDIPTLCKKLFK